MDDRKIKIAQAAIRVVSRYGLRKVTMSDLATESGVSRQTLYNIYSNKDEVVRDAISYATNKGINELRQAWEKDQTLDQKFCSFCRFGPLAWFDMIQSSPDAADLLVGLQSAGGQELAEGSQKWTRELETLLSEYDVKLTETTLTPRALAEFIYTSSAAAKSSAKNRQHT